MAESSWIKLAHAVGNTAKVSVETMLDGLLKKGTRDSVNARLARWSKYLIEEAQIQLTVEGLSALPPDETFVVMSNHQSMYDIPVIYQSLPLSLRMVAKAELFKIPVFGPALEVAEFISVERGNQSQSRKSIALAERRLAEGVSIWIAPEGTRSTTGKLGPFKKGGFIMALDARCRILPVTISGTVRVMTPHTYQLVLGQPVHVQIHEPVNPLDFGYERRDELVAHVRGIIEQGLR